MMSKVTIPGETMILDIKRKTLRLKLYEGQGR